MFQVLIIHVVYGGNIHYLSYPDNDNSLPHSKERPVIYIIIMEAVLIFMQSNVLLSSTSTSSSPVHPITKNFHVIKLITSKTEKD